MRWNPLHVSLDTVLAASPMLGQELEDRSSIRSAQDARLAARCAAASRRRLRGEAQRDLFCVAPLDLLVSEESGRKQVHLLELNGTGIGGVSNLPDQVTADLLESLAESCSTFEDPEGVVLVAVSGKEAEDRPRLNRLMHEKLLFLQAVREGLTRRFGRASAVNLPMLARGEVPRGGGPAVALGYIKDLLNAFTIDLHGDLWLHGRRVLGAVNDRFCRNVQQRFGEGVDLSRLRTFNRCFAAGSDKGVAYGLMNEYARANPHPLLPREILHAHAESRMELLEEVLHWLRLGRRVVIKPHGTGLGHGIEFFLDPRESLESITARIDRSLALTEEYYGIDGGALPYTVCEFVDACRVASPRHPLFCHKYELRVVVYRRGGELLAFPSIAKIARERDDHGGRVRRALINNITACGDTNKVRGTDFMLPLCSPATLETLDLTVSELEHLCSLATGYVRHVLDRVEDSPEQFGLPANRVAAPRQVSLPVPMRAAA